MKPNRVHLLIAVCLLAAAGTGCGGTYWPADAFFVTRVYVEPLQPATGSDALVFINYADTHIYAGHAGAQLPNSLEVTASAGALSEVSEEEYSSLRAQQDQFQRIYHWQTPATPQLVLIQASLPDGAKSIKVKVVAADLAANVD